MPEDPESVMSPETDSGSGGRSLAETGMLGLDAATRGEVKGLRLGRYPFAAAAGRYMQSRRGIVADTTYTEEARKLKYIGRIIEELRREGRVKSSDPRKISRSDIQELLLWMRARGLDTVTQAKYMQILDGILRYYGNRVIRDMRDEGVRFPKPGRKAIRVIGEEDLASVFGALETVQGWRGSLARGLIALGFSTGARHKEMRLAHVEDLDLEKMKFFVRHPKGEGSWASPEYVDIIVPQMVPLLRRYLAERELWLAAHGIRKAKALFPNVRNGRDGFYTDKSLRATKKTVEKAAGVRFMIKDLRSTLTSMTVNLDPKLLPAMSLQLRHSSPTTTQRYYASIRQGLAGGELREAWTKKNPITPENTVIDRDNDYAGYA